MVKTALVFYRFLEDLKDLIGKDGWVSYGQ